MVQKSANTTNLFDLMTPEEQQRVKTRKVNEDLKKATISREWMGLSELGFYYGWPAVQAVLEDYISLEEADMFVTGARRIHSGQVYDNAIADLAASSKSHKTFKSLMKPYLEDMNRAV